MYENIEKYKKVALSSLLFPCLLTISCSNETATQAQAPKPQKQGYKFELIPHDEAEQIADIAQKTMLLQNKRAAVLEVQQGKKVRGVHPKSHGCIKSNFEVNQDLPANLQVGLFATPGKSYDSLIRYSNAAVRIAPDLENGENGSRGMAIKVFNVNGDVLIKDSGEKSQDFLMINTPAFAFPNVRSYLRLTNALVESPSGVDPRAAFAPAADWTDEDRKNLGKTIKMITKIKSLPVRNPLDVQYFAAAPSAFGNGRVMKFSAEPCGGAKNQAAFTALDNPVANNYLQDALAATMQQAGNLCLDIKIQVLDVKQVKADRWRTDVSGDIIEDATREWSEIEYPFTSVAKIIIPRPQTIDLSDSTQNECKAKAFNPWHALVAHKPLGGINRLRKPVYLSSAGNR